jgi:hypothetical protein
VPKFRCQSAQATKKPKFVLSERRLTVSVFMVFGLPFYNCFGVLLKGYGKGVAGYHLQSGF